MTFSKSARKILQPAHSTGENHNLALYERVFKCDVMEGERVTIV